MTHAIPTVPPLVGGPFSRGHITPRVILLVGASNVGKTSIANELIPRLPGSSYHTCASKADEIIRAFFENKSPEAMGTAMRFFGDLSKVYDALIAVRMRKKVCCSDEVFQALTTLNAARKEFELPAVEECTREVARLAEEKFNSGCSCICGVENLSGVGLGRGRYTKVLVYCPISMLVERILKSNEEAIATERYSLLKRGTSCLKHFGLLFRPVERGERPLVSITRKELTEGVQRLFIAWQAQVGDKTALDVIIEDVFKAFSFLPSAPARLGFVPKEIYDLIIDSSKYSPSGAAWTILT